MRCPGCRGSVELITGDTLVCVERCGWNEMACEHGNPCDDCQKCVAQSYCGCCGDEIGTGDWCKRCVPHVKPSGAPEMRTYFAQFNKDCPFQCGPMEGTSRA